MTESSPDAGRPDPTSRAPRPTIDDPVIDDALAELDDLDAVPLADHQDRLVRAHEVLQGSLDRVDPADPS